jgi:hypothetical protein
LTVFSRATRHHPNDPDAIGDETRRRAARACEFAGADLATEPK